MAPADYKHYVLPMLFLRYLSLRYEQRYRQLKAARKDLGSDYYTSNLEMDQVARLINLIFGTGIPAYLWFLSKNRRGSHSYRYRLDEILFIDARGMGEMVNRRQRALSDRKFPNIARFC